MTDSDRILGAALDQQTPYPSPESVVSKELAGFQNTPTPVERRKAARITAALRAAGWRILR